VLEDEQRENVIAQEFHREITSLKYDPSLAELMIGVGHPFFFNQKSQRFELDINPFGDTNLIPMNNVAISNDHSQLTFDAKYRRKQQQFSITAANEHERILFEVFARLNANGLTTEDYEADKVELHFENGKLTLIQIYKRPKPAEELVDSLRIVGDADGYRLIKQCPWRKFGLAAIEVNDNKLISRSADEEFVYTLDLQPVILDAVKRLVDGSLSPGGLLRGRAGS
jgi:hypothetical protein